MTDPICHPAGPGASTAPQDLRERIAAQINDAAMKRSIREGWRNASVGGIAELSIETADAIIELLKGVVQPLEWGIVHDHWRAASLDGVYSVGDAGGGYAFVSAPYGGEVKTMRVYPFDLGKPVAEALHARAQLLAALGVK